LNISSVYIMHFKPTIVSVILPAHHNQNDSQDKDNSSKTGTYGYQSCLVWNVMWIIIFLLFFILDYVSFARI